MLSDKVNQSLMAYCEANILPRYRNFDKAHREDHALGVVDAAMKLATYYDVDVDMIYTAAIYHDTGLAEGRETHHLASGRIIRADNELHRWFTEDQIETIAQAAEDHRASGKSEPRSIYGKIIAEADRKIIPESIIRRTIQYGISNYPELSREEHYQRMLHHLHEKYAEGGYLKLWLPESPNAENLVKLREIIKDEAALRQMFEEIYSEEACH